MKEATGELNMTVVTVVAIVAVGAFFYAFIWPGIKDSISGSTACANGQNYTTGKEGQPGYISCGKASGGSYTCKYCQDSGNSDGKCTTKTVKCQLK